MPEPQVVDRTAVACVQCRNRHVKCDAAQAPCGRCKREGKDCFYRPSKRGGLDKAALERRRLRLQQEAEAARQNPTGHIEENEHPAEVSLNPSNVNHQSHLSIQVSGDRLLDLYYANFWPSVPMVLPHRRLKERLQNKSEHGVGPLLFVLQWIGSIYALWTPWEPYYETAVEALRQPAPTPFNVQALILLALGQYNCDKQAEAHMTMEIAIALAMRLHMNTREFAQAYGEGDVVLEESWRRTYYILYNFNLEFTIISKSLNFALKDVPILVDLPCEDEAYTSGNIPPSVRWEDFEVREFESIEIVFSSLAYKHDLNLCVTTMMNMLTSGGTFDENFVAYVDTRVASWHALLPSCKKDPMRMDGTIDEVMFQAHASAAILMTVHRPFSVLTYSIEEFSTETFHVLVPFVATSLPRRASHTARALKSLEVWTKLLSIPSAHEKHCVFVVSIAAQMATLQIAACKILLEGHALAIGRDRIRLMIGFINTLGMYWPLAKKTAKELKVIARAAFTNTQHTTQADVNAEVELAPEELVWPIIDPSSQIDIYAGTVLPMDWNILNSGYT